MGMNMSMSMKDEWNRQVLSGLDLSVGRSRLLLRGG